MTGVRRVLFRSDKERNKEKKKNTEKEKYIKETYDGSDKEEVKDTRKDREIIRKDWGSEDKIERKCKVSQEVTEAMISRLTSKSKAIDQESDRTRGRRKSGVEGDSGSGTECIAAREWRPIAFISKSLSTTQINWSTIQKQLDTETTFRLPTTRLSHSRPKVHYSY